AIRREFEEREHDPARRWFFEAFVPDSVGNRPWEEVPTDELAANPHYWELAPGARWHGFTHLAPGYAITDPNKLTLLTPGFARETGAYADFGIPAPVVAQYLRENQVVPEKNDLNSLLFLLTPGVESSKAGTLLSSLVAFKRLHDDNARLDDAIPDFVRRRPSRYAGVRLRDLCGAMHDSFPSAAPGRPAAARQRGDGRPRGGRPAWCGAMAGVGRCSGTNWAPHEAVRRLVRNDVDYLPIDKAFGRIATTLFVIRPNALSIGR